MDDALKKELENLLGTKIDLSKLSDEQIVKLVGEFYALPEAKRKKLYLGRGSYKETFSTPGNPDYVIKKVLSGAVDDYSDALEILGKDFLAHKDAEAQLAGKGLGGYVELPKLVIIPEKREAAIVQRKLHIPKSSEAEDLSIQLQQELEDKVGRNLTPYDLHEENIGIDPETKKTKIFDMLPSQERWDQIKKYNRLLTDYLKNLKETKVLRGIAAAAPHVLPAVKGAAKGLPLVGAYSSYSEARDEGMSVPKALAYTALEEANPTPVSSLDAIKMIKDMPSVIKSWTSSEEDAEKKALEDYKKSAAYRDRRVNRYGFGSLRNKLGERAD